MMKINRLSVIALLLVLITATSAVAGRNQAEDLWEQADKASQAGRYQEAIRLYERSLSLCGRSEPDCSSANLSGLGAVYDALNQNDKALKYYRDSLAIDRQRNSKPDIALALLNIGAVLYKGMERYSEAEPLFQESLALYRSLGKQEEVSLLLTHLGSLKTLQGQFKEALRYQEEALAIARKLTDKLRLADILSSIGNTSNQLGIYDKADKYLSEALTLLRRQNEPELLATALNYKGLNDFDLGRIDRALAGLDEALAVCRKSGNRQKAAMYTNNLGIIQMKIGQYDQARKYYSQALKLARELKQLGLQATALNNLGQVENALANHDLSIQYTQEALLFNRRLGRNNEISVNLNNIGKSHYDAGRYAEALSWHNQALALRRKQGNLLDIAASLDNIGAVQLFGGDLGGAENTFLERRRLQSQVRSVKLRNPGLAETWLQTGRYSLALELLLKEPLVSGAGEPAVAEYEMMLGRALMGVGRLREGSFHLLTAYRMLEEMRSSSSDRNAFLSGGGAGGRYRTYRALTAAVAERVISGDNVDDTFRAYGRNLADAAFTFSEATKTRSLLERIAGQGQKNLGATVLPNHLANREHQVRSRLNAIDATREQALRAGGQYYRSYSQNRLAAAMEMEELIVLLRKEQPLYAALNYPRPVSAHELPLADNELLLAYAVGEEASYLFVTRKGAGTKIHKIPLSRGVLEKKVKSLLEPMLTRDFERFSVKDAAELYRLLLSSGLADARPEDRIIVVPDGILGSLPFEILVTKLGKDANSSSYVGDKLLFSYYQSASLLALKRTLPVEQAVRPLFALGNPVFSGNPTAPGSFRSLSQAPKQTGQQIEFPSLPETETEVRKIAALFNVDTRPPDILLGVNATETELNKVSLGEYRFLHFATHASLPGLIREMSEPFILLGRNSTGVDVDGFLTLSEVLNLRLKADMVMLSACLTGVGKDVQGEGVANFARAFQSAGSRRVVVSLWEVASEPAVEYVSAYYTELKAGKSHAQALKRARDIMREKMPHPYFWGVFILHGEG